MKGSKIQELGVPRIVVGMAQKLCGRASSLGYSKEDMKEALSKVVGSPDQNLNEPAFGELAADLVDLASKVALDKPVPFKVWGDQSDEEATEQMRNACSLPVAVRGAMMPDNHLGYGLPIGGVLATEDAVVPWAVGVDIACRMKLTVFEFDDRLVETKKDVLKKILQEETRFGRGCHFKPGNRRDHDVLSDPVWDEMELAKGLKDKAWSQLGTSGGGNHFVEFGIFEIEEEDLGLVPGRYLSLLSHSGSRGPGYVVSNHFAGIAMEQNPQLDGEIRKLGWLDMDSEEGQQYWRAMNLMGRYASACHATIHDAISQRVGGERLATVENHHNFAVKEVHDGKEVYVHRKGATPASEGELGVIPGTMIHPAYVVRGKGNESSLRSAAHGAGRRMSRTQAKGQFSDEGLEQELADAGVELISAGLDEAPGAYKDIDEVMAEQEDLVDIVAKFIPKIVKMAPREERKY